MSDSDWVWNHVLIMVQPPCLTLSAKTKLGIGSADPKPDKMLLLVEGTDVAIPPCSDAALGVILLE